MAKKDTRLFARIDLDYADHPKIDRLSDAAFRAHVEMILYARKYMTDGVIPKRFANRVATDSLSELLANDADSPSLIDLGDGTYLLHGYADMNETRAEIERRSRANTENGRRGGLAKKRLANRTAKRVATDSLSEKGSENVAETETETETDISLSKERDSRAKRGSRLQPDWTPSPESIAKIRDECPTVDSQREHPAFIDYWIAQPGQKGVKLDWDATWRNWMRRKQGDVAGKKLTPTERAAQTAAAGRRVAGQQVTSLTPREIGS